VVLHTLAFVVVVVVVGIGKRITWSFSSGAKNDVLPNPNKQFKAK